MQQASCRPCAAEDSGTPIPFLFEGVWGTDAHVVGERRLMRRQGHPFRLSSTLSCAAPADSR